MADRKLFFTVGADIGPGTKAFQQFGRDAKRSLKDVDDSVEDMRSNAQRVADALNGVFEEIDSAILETKATADTLAAAMGPELSAKVDSTKVVGEFQRLGLTLDEIKADADVLADTLRRADDVSLKHFSGEADRAKSSLDGVRDSGDQSRSVLANLAGNSAQDLGQVAGVAGTLGVGLGQIVEYSVDGNVSLGNLAKTAGPLALVAGAGFAIAKGIGEAQKKAENARQQIEDFTQALLDGKDAADQFVDELSRTGELQLRTFFGDMTDIADELHRSGITAQQFGEAIEGGVPALQGLADAARQARADGDDLLAILQTGAIAIEDYSVASERAKRVAELTGGAQKDLALEMLGATAATEDLEDATDDASDAVDLMAQRAEDLDREWQELKGTLSEQEAFLSLRDQFDQVKAAAEESWNAAASGAEDAEQKARDHEGAVLDLKNQVINYGEQIGLLPDQVETYLKMIDTGGLADVERRIANLRNNSTINMQIQAKGAIGYRAPGQRDIHTGAVVTDAHEGAWVGRDGAEEWWAPDNFTQNTGRMHSTEDARRMNAGRASAPLVAVGTLNVTNGQDVGEALEKLAWEARMKNQTSLRRTA